MPKILAVVLSGAAFLGVLMVLASHGVIVQAANCIGCG